MKPKELTDYYGNQELAADAIGRNQSTVSDWVRADRIPDKAQLLIERQTNCALRADAGCFERVTGIKASPAKVAQLVKQAIAETAKA